MGREKTKQDLLRENRELKALLEQRDSELMKHRAQALAGADSSFLEWIQNHTSAICVHDLEGNYLEANEQFCAMLGYSREELLALNISHVTTDFNPRMYQEVLAQAASAASVGMEGVYRKKDGDIIMVSIHTGVLENDRGEIVVDLVQNITERKNTEQQLQEYRTRLEDLVRERTEELTKTNADLRREIRRRGRAEKRHEEERELLRTLIDNLPDHIFIKDPRGRYMLDNRAHAEFLGRKTPSGVIGKTSADFFPEKLAEKYQADDREVIESGQPLIERKEPTFDREGRPRWVSTSKIPIRDDDGRIRRLVCISRDITELKRAQDALEDERNLLRTLIDNMPDFIFIKDAESRFVVSNISHARALGLENPRKMAGRTDFDYFPSMLAGEYFVDEQRIVSTGTPMIDHEEPTVDASGHERWLSTTKVPLRSSRGRVKRIVGISRDITERKRFEKALQKAKDELEIRVAERTSDLREANKSLAVRLNQLDFLNATSYALAQIIDLNELYPSMLQAFISRFPEAEGSICVRDGKNFVCTAATPALDNTRGRAASENALQRYADRTLQAPKMIRNWRENDKLGVLNWPVDDSFSSYLAIPLLSDNRMVGCIQVFTTDKFTELYRQEKPLLTTLSAHAAVCRSNAVHYKELGEKARLEGELEAARNIQRSFTPQFRPSIPHVTLKGVYYPAFEVGGDYLDYFENEDGHWVIVIADVCGKGVPAALLMTVLRSTFRVEARGLASARAILSAVNQAMQINLDNRSFVTAICLVLDRDGKTMSYSRAGHPQLLKVPADGGNPESIDCAGIALGLTSDHKTFDSLLDEVRIPLRTGDRYLIYTDGLTEATNGGKDSYGMERLERVVTTTRSCDPDGIIRGIMADIRAFTGTAPYHDDLTMLALEVID